MNLSDYDLVKLKSKVESSMRKATPKDTGNLAYNSMRSYVNKNGIKIIYSGGVAGYGKILNQSIILGDGKINRHFGWHNRATLNAILETRRFLGDKNVSKNSKIYNNRQEATYNPEVPGSEKPMFAQREKWYNNSARVRFETMNKV